VKLILTAGLIYFHFAILVYGGICKVTGNNSKYHVSTAEVL